MAVQQLALANNGLKFAIFTEQLYKQKE